MKHLIVKVSGTSSDDDLTDELYCYCAGLEDLKATMKCFGNEKHRSEKNDTIVAKLNRRGGQLTYDYSNDNGVRFDIYQVFKRCEAMTELNVETLGFKHRVKLINIGKDDLEGLIL